MTRRHSVLVDAVVVVPVVVDVVAFPSDSDPGKEFELVLGMRLEHLLTVVGDVVVLGGEGIHQQATFRTAMGVKQ